MPTTNTVLFVIYATDETGEKVFRQLGVKYLDGEQIAYYVFDFDDYTQTNLPGAAEIVGNEVRGVFPWDEVVALGESFRWHSTLNVAGDDIDFCPDRADGAVFPKPLTFPAS